MLHDLHHRTLKVLRENFSDLSDRKFLLAVSGGRDSMVLLAVMSDLAQVEKFGVRVLHCHHGQSSELAQLEFRDKAEKIVRRNCDERKVDFVLMRSDLKLTSENDYREFRIQSAQKNKLSDEVVVTAHHAEDQLETQLLHLIRGSGFNGLEGMRVYDQDFFRPWLSISKKDIQLFAQERNINWIEDPSNQSDIYLRNWVRNSWLSALEERQAGAVSSLSRSFSLIISELHNASNVDVLPEGAREINFSRGILWREYLSLSSEVREMVLALYLRYVGQNEFSRSQVQEIKKQLDKNQTVHTFRVAKCEISVNAERILVQKLS